MVSADLFILVSQVEEMEDFGWFEVDWYMCMALKIRGEEMREEGQEEVLDLMEQGYSAQQIRDMLTRQQSTTTTAHT
jgi:hypothetical protein